MLADIIGACKNRLGMAVARQPVRQVLVILSVFPQSDSLRETAQAALAESGALVFTVVHTSSIGFPDSFLGYQGGGGRVAALGYQNDKFPQIAEASGGRTFSDRNLAETFAQIREQIESMYLLSYSLPKDAVQGKAHRVEIEPAKDSEISVRAPKSYIWSPWW